MQDLIKQLTELSAKISSAMDKLGIERDRQELLRLRAAAVAPDFWHDPAQAAATSQRLASLERRVNDWTTLAEEVTEALELAKLGDPQLQTEIQKSYDQRAVEYARREFELKLAGPYDQNSALVSIYAGTGGTDAQDWAEMLQRMYLRYAEKAGYVTAMLDQSPGEEAGIKSVTLEVNGPLAFGRLKSEQGVHRLVRLSPFNADHLRQTSFALVEVMPQIEEPKDLEIDPADIRTDVFRAGGHGGQSVNTTDSAVRLTHLPTGTVVTVQNERSQLQNKDKAMQVLRSRLAAIMLQQHKEKLSEIRGATQSAEWGNQIRSYVLHPYTKVKDHRTGAETADAAGVLDGNLDLFIEAYLGSQIGKP